MGFLERLDFRLEEPDGIDDSAGFADPGLSLLTEISILLPRSELAQNGIADLLWAVHLFSGLCLSPSSRCRLVIFVIGGGRNGFGDLLSLGPST